uniref:Reverse transcriptase Ty1/copia-type domain-containing protein n=1 Tax=Ananas comosus var. bracteatus TaxID=296719 RepID=A0A6V7PK71_ANACO|nr:unnamed protein product [Ananas comosus var. bracteatus]
MAEPTDSTQAEETPLEQSSESDSTTSSRSPTIHSPQAKNIFPLGVPPPPHNIVLISSHPMQTRTRIGTHTGHVQTNFRNNPQAMIAATQVPCPPNTNVVGSKWVFKTKLNPDGSVERFKARLVAKGFSQVPRVDFGETFSPILKPTTLRLVLALATTLSWPLQQLDVKNAFIHGYLKETVYMSQPPGFVNSQYPDYGTILLLLYVDDIVLAASNATLMQNIIDRLSMDFAIKDLGTLHYFLGIEVTPFSGGIFLSQMKYARDILLRASMLEASSISTPSAIKENNTSVDGNIVDATAYRSIVGTLQYLIVTRIDITLFE